MILEHESEWSNKAGLWYMPILKWETDDGGTCGKLLGIVSFSPYGLDYVYDPDGCHRPFMLSYN